MSRTRQRFTGAGWLGIASLFVGPIVSGYGYWGLSSKLVAAAQNPYMASYVNLSADYWMLGIGAFGSLAAIPLLLIGREFEVVSDGAPVFGTPRREPGL